MTGGEVIALGVLLLTLLPIVYYDLSQRRIPDLCTLGLASAGLIARVALQPAWRTAVDIAIALTLALVAALALWWGAKALKRADAIGMGDLKFFVAVSIWLGFPGATLMFVVASFGSVLWSLAVAPWQGFNLKRELPFGPFLALGTLIVFCIERALS
jgi:prepilin signal peptidase PulO-like enzyme (type II secretory pathway)